MELDAVMDKYNEAFAKADTLAEQDGVSKEFEAEMERAFKADEEALEAEFQKADAEIKAAKEADKKALEQQ